MALVLFTLPLLGDITLGTALSVGGMIAGFLLRPHQPGPQFKQMTSSWGETHPITFNDMRISGLVIQASQVTKHSSKSKKGGPTYSQTIAVSFGEGVRNIGRIWADNTVIYDPRPLSTPSAWQANTTYSAGDVIFPTGVTNKQLTATVDGDSGAIEPTWNLSNNASTRDNTEVWIASTYKPRTKVGPQYNFTMRIYNGTEDQSPDSALEEIVGVGYQPAYRGLVYIVLEGFNLSKYGNRVPNLEAEITPFVYPIPFFTDTGFDFIASPAMSVDPSGRYGYRWVNRSASLNFTLQLAKVSLTNPNVVALSDPISTGTYYHTGAFPPIPSWTGTELWQFATIDFGGPSEQLAMIAYDKTTLRQTRVLAASTTTPSPAFPASVNIDGTLLAGFQNGASNSQFVYLMNTANGKDSLTDISTVGGPASDLVASLYYTPVFDNGNHLWFYDDHGQFWVFTVTLDGSGVPVLSAGASYTGRADDGAFYGPVDFNPDTGIVTAWSPGFAGLYAVPIDSVSKTVGTVYLLANAGGMEFGIGSDLSGWNNKRYAAIGKDSFPTRTVGLFDRQTGTETYFSFGFYYDVDTPACGFSTMAASEDGKFIVAANYATGSDPHVDFYFFPVDLDLLSLEQISADVSRRVGLTDGDFDYGALSTIRPQGCGLLSRDTCRSFLESLQPAFFFDITDVGPLLIGINRVDSVSAVTIPEDDLGASDKIDAIADRIQIQRNDDREIPQDLSIGYYDSFHDYQMGSQHSRRNNVTNYSSGRNNTTVPVVMTPGDAANAAERSLYLLWMERDTIKLTVPLQYLRIAAGDLITAVRGGENYQIRVSKATLNPSQLIEIEGVSEDTGIYSITVTAPTSDMTSDSPFEPGTVNPIVQPVLAVLDTALLRSSDIADVGVYLAGCASEYGGGWDGESVQESSDNSTFEEVQTLTVEATIGTTVGALGNCLRWTVPDNLNTVDVVLLAGVLGNATLDALVASNQTNAMWFSNGEIVQFETAELIDTNTYRLSGFLRGRFGTESFCGTHASGETVVLLIQDDMQTVTIPVSDIGATRYWKGVNDAPDFPETAVQTLTMAMRRLMPYAPFFLRGSRDNTENLTITGLRRNRWKGQPLWTPQTSDTPAVIEIDILNGMTVVRTITATASSGGSSVTDPAAFSALYTAADQVTDFGSTQSFISIVAYEINATRGRGYGGAKGL